MAEEEVGRVNREGLEAMIEDMKDGPPTDVEICRIESCFQESSKKVVFCVKHPEKEALIAKSFAAMGARVTKKMAPAGNLEE